jgi:hypothetical protein
MCIPGSQPGAEMTTGSLEFPEVVLPTTTPPAIGPGITVKCTCADPDPTLLVACNVKV